MALKRNVELTHTVYEKGLALAHIQHINEETQTIKYEWAVVRNPILDPEHEYYKTWGYSLGYYNTYQEAKEKFVETVRKDRKARGEKGDFCL